MYSFTSTLSDNLRHAMEVEGALGVALMDSRSGMCLGSQARTNLDVQRAAASNVEVVRAKNALRDRLGLSDHIEDIMISLETQDHLIRPSRFNEHLFFYYMLEGNGNLPRARMTLRRIESSLEAVLNDLPVPEEAPAESPDPEPTAPAFTAPEPTDAKRFEAATPLAEGLFSRDTLFGQDDLPPGASVPAEDDFLLELGMSGLGI